MRRAVAALGLVAILAAHAAAAEAPAKLEGVWSATNASKQVFRGFWTAEVAPATPDVALGTWSMVDDHGKTVMGGTWSARHTPRGWRGAWSARIGAGNDVVSGTWEADDSTLKGAKTFRDMLARAGQKQIAGVWRMGHAHGNWWLQPGGRGGQKE
jgi:hypothetical protein